MYIVGTTISLFVRYGGGGMDYGLLFNIYSIKHNKIKTISVVYV